MGWDWVLLDLQVLVQLGWQEQAYLEYLVWLLEVVALLVEKQGRAREKARMEREKVVRDLRVFCLVFLEVKLGRQEKVAKKAKEAKVAKRARGRGRERERGEALSMLNKTGKTWLLY